MVIYIRGDQERLGGGGAEAGDAPVIRERRRQREVVSIVSLTEP